MNTKIKFCGFTNSFDLKIAGQLGINYFGFVVEVSSSPRSISFEKLSDLLLFSKLYFKHIQTVAVLKNPSENLLNKLLKMDNLDILQFHSLLNLDELFSLKQFIPKSKQIWQALEVEGDSKQDTIEILKKVESLQNLVNNILLDKPKNSLLKEFSAPKIFLAVKEIFPGVILAGGLNYYNLSFFLDTLKPACIDLVSGVEAKYGQKEPEIMTKIVNLVRNYEN